MTCAQPSFDSPANAHALRRVANKHRLRCAYYLCSRCDKYHVRSSMPNPTHQRVIELVSEGYRDREIADLTGMTKYTVQRLVNDFAREVYALNRPHLIAICISLGIINPHSFVQEIGEHGGESP